MGPLRNRAREAAVDRGLLDSPGFSGETRKQPQADPGDTPATGHQDLQGADPGQDIGPKARGREQSEIPGAPVSFILAWRIPTDRGAWPATVDGVEKSWTQPSN